MQETIRRIVNVLGLACWVEIKTERPCCTYYFGPFLTRNSARAATEGYLEDLRLEMAQGFQVSIRRCRPQELTVF